MDTVWIRLSIVNAETNTVDQATEVFMFGAGHVVSFAEESSQKTALKRSDNSVVAFVYESEDEIMSILRKMRQTEGRLDGKQGGKTKETRSKNKARKAKASK